MLSESDGVVTEEDDYFSAIEIGADSQVEFCRIMYGEVGLNIAGLPKSEGTNTGYIRHNCISYCCEGIRVDTDALSNEETLNLFNNLVCVCNICKL